MPAAVLWDMDGTLVDSEPLWGVATYELAEKLGRPLTPELRERTVGGSFANTLSICAAHAGYKLKDGDYERFRNWMYKRMAELFSGRLKPNPGIYGLLSSLRGAGVPMMVVTNTERELADVSIAAVGSDFFVGSIAGDEVAPKPAPDGYLEAARRVGARPQDCLVFEDSWAGMSAAAAAGCHVLGLSDEVPEGVRSFDPSLFLGADHLHVSRWFVDLMR
ncbi:HAD family hydrolase [Corynebacterium mayonis]|uniref:HAD family hydrolase n=1 Tax=Corynebacterium mayonis TaxID=3062461 RepID=UPI003140BFA8